MTRKETLRAMRAAGAEPNAARWTRLFTEGSVSHAKAQEAWKAGMKMGAFIRKRDAEKLRAE